MPKLLTAFAFLLLSSAAYGGDTVGSITVTRKIGTTKVSVTRQALDSDGQRFASMKNGGRVELRALRKDGTMVKRVMLREPDTSTAPMKTVLSRSSPGYREGSEERWAPGSDPAKDKSQHKVFWKDGYVRGGGRFYSPPSAERRRAIKIAKEQAAAQKLVDDAHAAERALWPTP